MIEIDETYNPHQEEQLRVAAIQAMLDNQVADRVAKMQEISYGQDPTRLQDALNAQLISILADNYLLYGLADYVMRGGEEYYFNSDFVDCLNPEDKRIYLHCDLERIVCEELPYFSTIVEVVSIIRLIERLKQTEDKQPVTVENNPKQTFAPSFSTPQLQRLLITINETAIFTNPINISGLQRMFECDLADPLQVSNLKLLVYMLDELSKNNFITPAWQKVVVANKLFLSKHGKQSNDHDLRGAKRKIYDRYEGTKPKNHKIIDDCIDDIASIN